MRSTSLVTSHFSLALALVGTLAFVGCKKDQTTTPDGKTTDAGDAGDASGGEPAGDSGAGGAEEGGAAGGDEGGGGGTAVKWAEMDRQARMEHMGTVVMPKMKEAFKTRGQDIKCANCHGANYKEVDFEMPNDLTPLSPENPIQSGMDIDEETTKFMVATVMPQMAELLGMQTDVTTGKGEFGCLSCHLSE
jgi:hypothetical protein